MKKIIGLFLYVLLSSTLLAKGLTYTEVLLLKTSFYPFEKSQLKRNVDKLKHTINQRNDDKLFISCLEKNEKSECIKGMPVLELSNYSRYIFVNNKNRKPVVLNLMNFKSAKKVIMMQDDCFIDLNGYQCKFKFKGDPQFYVSKTINDNGFDLGEYLFWPFAKGIDYATFPIQFMIGLGLEGIDGIQRIRLGNLFMKFITPDKYSYGDKKISSRKFNSLVKALVGLAQHESTSSVAENL